MTGYDHHVRGAWPLVERLLGLGGDAPTEYADPFRLFTRVTVPTPGSASGARFVRGYEPRLLLGQGWYWNLRGSEPYDETRHGLWEGLHPDETFSDVLSPQQIWAVTDGEEGEAPLPAEIDWRPNEALPEDFNTYALAPTEYDGPDTDERRRLFGPSGFPQKPGFADATPSPARELDWRPGLQPPGQGYPPVPPYSPYDPEYDTGSPPAPDADATLDYYPNPNGFVELPVNDYPAYGNPTHPYWQGAPGGDDDLGFPAPPRQDGLALPGGREPIPRARIAAEQDLPEEGGWDDTLFAKRLLNQGLPDSGEFAQEAWNRLQAQSRPRSPSAPRYPREGPAVPRETPSRQAGDWDWAKFWQKGNGDRKYSHGDAPVNYADESTVSALLAQLASAEQNAHRWGRDPALRGLRGIVADALDDVGRGREAALLRMEGRHVMVTPDGRVVPGRAALDTIWDRSRQILQRISDWNAGDYPYPEFDFVAPGVNEGYYRPEDTVDPEGFGGPVPPGHVRLVDIDPAGQELHGFEDVEYPNIGRAVADRLESHMSMFDPLEWADDPEAADLELTDLMRGLADSPFEEEDPDFQYQRGGTNYAEEDEIRRAIAADPGELTGHGAYADWLEENDRAADAGFRRAVMDSLGRRFGAGRLGTHGSGWLDATPIFGDSAPQTQPHLRVYRPFGPMANAAEGIYLYPRTNADPYAPDYRKRWTWGPYESGEHGDSAADPEFVRWLTGVPGMFDPEEANDDLSLRATSWDPGAPFIRRPLTPAQRAFAGVDRNTPEALRALGPEGWAAVERMMRNWHERGLRFEDGEEPTAYAAEPRYTKLAYDPTEQVVVRLYPEVHGDTGNLFWRWLDDHYYGQENSPEFGPGGRFEGVPGFHQMVDRDLTPEEVAEMQAFLQPEEIDPREVGDAFGYSRADYGIWDAAAKAGMGLLNSGFGKAAGTAAGTAAAGWATNKADSYLSGRGRAQQPSGYADDSDAPVPYYDLPVRMVLDEPITPRPALKKRKKAYFFEGAEGPTDYGQEEQDRLAWERRLVEQDPWDAVGHGEYADWLDEHGHTDEAALRRAVGEFIRTAPVRYPDWTDVMRDVQAHAGLMSKRRGPGFHEYLFEAGLGAVRPPAPSPQPRPVPDDFSSYALATPYADPFGDEFLRRHPFDTTALAASADWFDEENSPHEAGFRRAADEHLRDRLSRPWGGPPRTTDEGLIVDPDYPFTWPTVGARSMEHYYPRMSTEESREALRATDLPDAQWWWGVRSHLGDEDPEGFEFGPAPGLSRADRMRLARQRNLVLGMTLPNLTDVERAYGGITNLTDLTPDQYVELLNLMRRRRQEIGHFEDDDDPMMYDRTDYGPREELEWRISQDPWEGTHHDALADLWAETDPGDQEARFRQELAAWFRDRSASDFPGLDETGFLLQPGRRRLNDRYTLLTDPNRGAGMELWEPRSLGRGRDGSLFWNPRWAASAATPEEATAAWAERGRRPNGRGAHRLTEAERLLVGADRFAGADASLWPQLEAMLRGRHGRGQRLADDDDPMMYGPAEDEAAFRAAIAQNPQDVLARMAFADWLRDRGRDRDADFGHMGAARDMDMWDTVEPGMIPGYDSPDDFVGGGELPVEYGFDEDRLGWESQLAGGDPFDSNALNAYADWLADQGYTEEAEQRAGFGDWVRANASTVRRFMPPGHPQMQEALFGLYLAGIGRPQTPPEPKPIPDDFGAYSRTAYACAPDDGHGRALGIMSPISDHGFRGGKWGVRPNNLHDGQTNYVDTPGRFGQPHQAWDPATRTWVPVAPPGSVALGAFAGLPVFTAPGELDGPPPPMDWGDLFGAPPDGQTHYGDAEDEADFVQSIHRDPLNLLGHDALADWYADRGRTADEAFRRNLSGGIKRRLGGSPGWPSTDGAGWLLPGAPMGVPQQESPHHPGVPAVRVTSGPVPTGERNISFLQPFASNGDWALNDHPEGTWAWGVRDLHRTSSDPDLAAELGLGPDEDPLDWEYLTWNTRRNLGRRFSADNEVLRPEERLWAGIDDWANLDPRIWPQLEALLKRQHGRGERLAADDDPMMYGTREELLGAAAENPWESDIHARLSDWEGEYGDPIEADFRAKVAQWLPERIGQRPRWRDNNRWIESPWDSDDPFDIRVASPHGNGNFDVDRLSPRADGRWAGRLFNPAESAPGSAARWLGIDPNSTSKEVWRFLRKNPLNDRNTKMLSAILPGEAAYLQHGFDENTDPRLWPQIEALLRERHRRQLPFAGDEAPTAYGEEDDLEAGIRGFHAETADRLDALVADARARLGNADPNDPLVRHIMEQMEVLARSAAERREIAAGTRPYARAGFMNPDEPTLYPPNMRDEEPLPYGDHEQADFLRKILENPAEQSTALAYVDWLRENGREAEADVIQNALAQYPEAAHRIGRAPRTWGERRFTGFPRPFGDADNPQEPHVTLDHYLPDDEGDLHSFEWRFANPDAALIDRLARGLLGAGVVPHYNSPWQEGYTADFGQGARPEDRVYDTPPEEPELLSRYAGSLTSGNRRAYLSDPYEGADDMTAYGTKEDLFAELRKKPGDLALRMAIADWLEENETGGTETPLTGFLKTHTGGLWNSPDVGLYYPGLRAVTVGNAGQKGGYPRWGTAEYVPGFTRDGRLTWRKDRGPFDVTSGRGVTSPMIARAREHGDSIGAAYVPDLRQNSPFGEEWV